jgi:hypothetical protein
MYHRVPFGKITEIILKHGDCTVKICHYALFFGTLFEW